MDAKELADRFGHLLAEVLGRQDQINAGADLKNIPILEIVTPAGSYGLPIVAAPGASVVRHLAMARDLVDKWGRAANWLLVLPVRKGEKGQRYLVGVARAGEHRLSFYGRVSFGPDAVTVESILPKEAPHTHAALLELAELAWGGWKN
jgi:hypothetical protein